MEYRIQIEQFEGPLELLLALIEKEKLDITRVSLAEVTEQYLEYLRREEHISLEHLASFLSVAARLILIKSRALLPILEFTDDEETEVGDLESELKRYKLFKEAAAQIAARYGTSKIFSREPSLGSLTFFLPPKNFSGENLARSFRYILGGIPAFEKLEESRVNEVVTLEEKISLLQRSIQDRLERSFSEVIEKTKDRVHIIVSFLALLELVKQRIVHAEQGELFGEIRFRKHDGDTQNNPLDEKE